MRLRRLSFLEHAGDRSGTAMRVLLSDQWHLRLKGLLCRMLGVTRVPADHFQVFESITQYAVVDKEEVYEKLGRFGPKRKTNTGTTGRNASGR
jgi:hypothetical protein